MRPRIKNRRLPVAIGALCVAAALSGCSFTPLPKPTVAELAGVWVNDQTRLTLRDDQTFTLENAPAYTDPLGDENWRSGPRRPTTWTDNGALTSRSTGSIYLARQGGTRFSILTRWTQNGHSTSRSTWHRIRDASN